MAERFEELKKSISGFTREERERRNFDPLLVKEPEPVPVDGVTNQLLQRIKDLEDKLSVLSDSAVLKQELPPMSVDGKSINPMYCMLRTPHNSLLQQYGASFPKTPKERDTWYRTDLNQWFMYNGTRWVGLIATRVGQGQETVISGGVGVTKGLQNFYRLNSDGDYYNFSFFTPWDFNELVEAYVLVNNEAGAAGKNIDLSSEYGQVGEDYDTGSESDTASTFTFIADENDQIDVSTVLTGIAAGDWVIVKVLLREAYDVDIFRFQGLIFRYI